MDNTSTSQLTGHKRTYDKLYYEQNRERILARQREWRKKRKLQKQKPRPPMHAGHSRAEYRRRYYLENRDKLLEYQRLYYLKCKQTQDSAL